MKRIKVNMLKLVTIIVASAIELVAVAGKAEVIPEKSRAVIEKSQSFGIGKYPISFWSYTNLKEHGQYMTEDEVKSWADAGFTVPIGPRFDCDAQRICRRIPILGQGLWKPYGDFWFPDRR